MKREWCEYPPEHPLTYPKDAHYKALPNLQREGSIPRKRLVCPSCKKRLIARIIFDSDGDFCGYAIPRHKR